VLALTDCDWALASGEAERRWLAMRIILAVAEANEAPRLIDVSRRTSIRARITGGNTAERLARDGKVVIPTTLNGPLSTRSTPPSFHGDARLQEGRLTAYGDGGTPPDLCALSGGSASAFGEHVAWAESNAIVFVNSVLGARTDRYGTSSTSRCDHDGAGCRIARTRTGAGVGFELTGIRSYAAVGDRLSALGHLVKRLTGTAVPAIVGLPDDASRTPSALAAAASSGGVALFHAVGRTPRPPAPPPPWETGSTSG
jgi:predicted aconitase